MVIKKDLPWKDKELREEFLSELAWASANTDFTDKDDDTSPYNGVVVVSNEIVGVGEWTYTKQVVFTYEGETYGYHARLAHRDGDHEYDTPEPYVMKGTRVVELWEPVGPPMDPNKPRKGRRSA